MRRLARRAASALLLCSALPAVPTPAAAEGPTGVPLVIELDASASAAQRAEALRQRHLTVLDATPGADFVLAVADGAGAPSSGGVVESVAPLVAQRAMSVPNDPGYEFQWHLPAIDADTAWDVTTGAGVVVAVLDTGAAYRDSGIYKRAPDLAGTSFVPGWDFVDGDSGPDDDSGHGTHVTSIIAATTNNAVGVAGVAPGVSIMPVRVLDEGGLGSDWTASQGVRFAADHGADVINMSFGSSTSSSVLRDAIAYARGRGVTVVAASGNGTDGVGGPVSYPAAMPGVIGVGGVRYDRTRAPYSNYGPELDLAAPGGDLALDQNADGHPDGILAERLVDGPGTFGYAFVDGTSAAAPQVSAVAALLVSMGVQDPDAVETVLESTAVDLGPPGRDDEFGAGLLQSGAAVRSVLSPPPRGISNACPPGATPPTPFTDIGSSVHAAAIGCVAWWDIANGTTATTFRPGGNVTRAQLASFVARELEAAGYVLPATPPNAFSDDETSVHRLRIDQLAAVGVVQGRGGGTYAPNATVTRAEMATFLVRAHDLVDQGAPLAPGADRFLDDETSVHEANINKVATAGLAAGVGPLQFAPTAPVVRGQMATFLARLLDLFVTSGFTAPPP